MSNRYPRALKHEPIEEIFDDFYIVYGSIGMQYGLVRFSRNMTIIREGPDLILINPVRLNPGELQHLDSLGKVKHIIRLGVYHGRDDAFYRDRYDCLFWSQNDSRVHPEPAPDQVLDEQMNLPVSGAQIVEFRHAKYPECVIRTPHGGGTLVVCDCFQDWSEWKGCNLVSRLMMPRIGFEPRPLVGPIWSREISPSKGALKPDFERILQLDFRHFMGAHGSFCRDTAKEQLQYAVNKAEWL